MDKERYRVRWLDIARVFAIISVVNMHVTQEIFSYDLQIVLQDSRMEQIIKMCLFTFGRMGVPIFLFITGYLMLDREYDYEKSTDFFKNNLLGLVVSTEIWTIIYALFSHIYLKRTITVIDVMKRMLFLQDSDMTHMWYMPAIIGVYIFIPFISKALANMELVFTKIILFISFSYVFVASELNVLLHANGIEGVKVTLDTHFSGRILGVCIVLGYLVKKGVLDFVNTKVLTIIMCTSFLITWFLPVYSYNKGIEYQIWYDNATLIITCLALFVILSRINFLSSSLITRTSLYAFGIYLIHNPIAMLLVRELKISNNGIKYIITLLITFVISWLVVYVVSRCKKIAKVVFFIRE